jgi:MFS family permease
MKENRLFNRNFTLLFQGQLVSSIGSSAYMLALTFWLKHATGSATIMGLFAMTALLPGVLLGPLGGTLADHYSRKKIIVYGDFVNGSLIISIACLMIYYPTKVDLIVTLLFVEAAVNGVVMAIFRPAVMAIIPDLVPAKRLIVANGLMQNSFAITMVIGQSLGGVLFRILGAPLLMLLDGISYILSAFSESFIQEPERTVEHDAGWRETLQKFKIDTLDGFRFLKTMPGMPALLLMSAIMGFFMAPLGVLLPFFVEDTLGSTADWFGFMMAGLALGVMLGGILAGTFSIKAELKGKIVISGSILVSILYAGFGYSETALIGVLVMFCLGLIEGGVGVLITSAVQLGTPPNMRGRVFGLMTTLSVALAPVSMGLAGVVVDLLDKNIPLIFAISGCCVLLSVPVFFLSKGFHQLLAVEAMP